MTDAPGPWPRRRFLARAGGLALVGLAPGRALAAAPGPDGETILEDARSRFNHIRIGQRGSSRTMYFVSDEGVHYIESRIDLGRPQSLDLDYSRTMMAGFLIQPAPKSVLMLGLGGGQISNYLHHNFAGIEIDAVDIDPEVVRLAKRYFNVPADDPRYRTHVDDGRLFVEKSERRWDMIILDAFRGVFVPYHLKTAEFYQAVLDHLAPGGVVVANLHNATRMYPHDRNTLAAVFPQRYSFVSESGNQTTFVATGEATRVGAYTLRDNARALASRLDFDVLGLAARYYLRTDWELDAAVLRDDFKPAELDAAAARHNETCVKGCRYGH
ncbi:MAG: fused MFS/spermidine synthase [Nannocystaceae bacterium]